MFSWVYDDNDPFLQKELFPTKKVGVRTLKLNHYL